MQQRPFENALISNNGQANGVIIRDMYSKNFASLIQNAYCQGDDNDEDEQN